MPHEHFPRDPASRAVLYGRVSTLEQAESGTSLTSQLEMLRRWAKGLGAQVVAECLDDGVSGAKLLTRPEIQRALGFFRTGQANVLIVPDVSRAGRDLDVIRAIVREVRELGARIEWANGCRFEDNADGDMMLNHFGNVAEWERNKIRERTMTGMRRRALEGLQPSRTWQPMGYKIVTSAEAEVGTYGDRKAGEYLVQEEEAAIVRRIFDAVAGGQSLYAVAAALNRDGIPTPRGGSCWRPSTLRVILSNPVYVGRPAHGRTQRKADERRVGQLKNRRLVQNAEYQVTRPEEEWITLAAPAIVPEETWAKAQERMGENQKRLGGNPETKYLLSGLVRCPLCGRGMFHHKSKDYKGKEGRHYYKCGANRPGFDPATRCPSGSYRADLIEAAVIATLTELAKQPELIEAAIEAFDRARQSQPDFAVQLAALQADLEGLAKRQKTLIQAQIQGLELGATTDDYAPMFAEVARRRSELTARIGELEALLIHSPSEAPRTQAGKLALVLEALNAALANPDIPTNEKNARLSDVIERIVPSGESFEVRFRGVNMIAVASP